MSDISSFSATSAITDIEAGIFNTIRDGNGAVFEDISINKERNLNTMSAPSEAAKGALGKQMLAQSKFFQGYSRWKADSGTYETWGEAVERVMQMHRQKYARRMSPELENLMHRAQVAYEGQLVLGAQRALQFGGEQVRRHEARLYNCSASHVDRLEFFQQAMYLLLCGAGVGFSVQRRHVDRLPRITPRGGQARVFVIPDCIEGWADSFGVLLSSFFEGEVPFPAYQGARVLFDFSQIRPRGSRISGGFKAPGPDGLRQALERGEALLQSVLDSGSRRMRPIVAYDLTMHMANAVLSGGVRRSATICLFDKDDEEMLKAKTGNWYVTHPHRARSNNSVILKRDELTREQWARIMRSVRDFGEPGFVFVEDLDFMVNPCVEIGMLPKTADGRSGFQFCNLTEINGGKCVSREVFLRACEAAAILGTIQAGYTDFKYVGRATREITEREALIGVSITGWMNNPQVLFDEALLKEGAQVVRQTNRRVAALLGINPAARTTCAKPSGNASVLLGTASGIHGEHAPRYFRNVQMNVQDEVAQLIMARNPKMCEPSVWSSDDIVVSFPVVSKQTSVYKRDLMGVAQLEYVKRAQQHWVEPGTDESLCVHPALRHNISNTISVDDWGALEQYIFENRGWFAGISLLAAMGDKAYAQAPFTEVRSAQAILEDYGVASMFASEIIANALRAFNGNLWQACDTALGYGLTLSQDNARDRLKRDWVCRLTKFARKYFGGDVHQATLCLKDCHNLHKWSSIMNTMTDIDFAQELTRPKYVSADTLASEGCAGGACELSF